MVLTLEARDEITASRLGPVRQIKIFAPGYPPLQWREVWERFMVEYPGQWAVQMFPPEGSLVDGKAVYHLWVLENAPEGLDIRK